MIRGTDAGRWGCRRVLSGVTIPARRLPQCRTRCSEPRSAPPRCHVSQASDVCGRGAAAGWQCRSDHVVPGRPGAAFNFGPLC
eukprot:763256-Hanusia_phi.AAC.2